MFDFCHSHVGWLGVSAAAAGLVALGYAGHVFLRRFVDDGVVRDNGAAKPITPLTEAEVEKLRTAVPKDIWTGAIVSEDGSFAIDYLLALDRRSRSSKGLLVFCQGKMTVMQEGFHFLPFMSGHVLLFNYRGVGTPGRASLETVCQDAFLAYRFSQKVVSHLMAGGWGPPPDDQKIVAAAVERTALLGYSLGGFTAAEAVRRQCELMSRPGMVAQRSEQVAGRVLALMSTGTDMRESLIDRAPLVRFLYAPWLLKPRLHTEAVVSLPYPPVKLIGHGELDQTNYPQVDETGNKTFGAGFALRYGKRLFAAAPGTASRFFQFRGASHKDMCEKDPATVRAFFDAIYAAINGVDNSQPSA